ncbi:thiamine pyrophosphate-dependent enzyme [Streptomyces pseudovenezuelae]|uniref:thiamine pyrophosphate-dependent enzyme n=1 Tax=Streptomyces pseudovenezuelae TaxID=67350 RepID=UPI00371FFCEA
MERVVDVLIAATRPVIVVGGGAITSEASDQVLVLAERWQIPVVTTWNGKSAFPEDHELFAGSVGQTGTMTGNAIASSADVVISVGRRDSDRFPTQRPLGTLRNMLPRDAIIVAGSGNTQGAVKQTFPVYSPRTHLTSGSFSSMGWAIPAAVGAKLARPGSPDSPVVRVLGDGDFLMTPSSPTGPVRRPRPDRGPHGPRHRGPLGPRPVALPDPGVHHRRAPGRVPPHAGHRATPLKRPATGGPGPLAATARCPEERPHWRSSPFRQPGAPHPHGSHRPDERLVR